MPEQKPTEEDEKDIKTPFYGVIITAIILITIVSSLYFYNFREYGLSPQHEDWGTFGDFMGGTLNPLFAFLSLLALLKTLQIQSQELRATRKEMNTSSTALGEQSKSIKLQNFENTFFNMVNLHNDILKSLYLDKKSKKEIKTTIDLSNISYTIHTVDSINSKETITFLSDKLNLFFIKYNTLECYKENIKRTQNSFGEVEEVEIFNQYNQSNRTNDLYLKFHEATHQFISHYFRNMYQILKYIKNSEIDDKKFYSNIFRAQFSQDELKLLFYNCVSNIGNEKFLPLLIEFEFLEHLPFHKDINKKDIMYCVEETKELDEEYSDSKLFGLSKHWEEQIIKIKSAHEPL